MQKSVWNIYKTFFKIGTILLGGGYVILPLLQSEIVDKKGWTNSEDIVEYFALSQSLPGIIAANISIFVGYKLQGVRGALAAITGVITPAFLAIVLIANILSELVAKHSIQSIFSGVAVGVVILVLLTVKEMWGKSLVDNFTRIVFLISMILACLKVSPVLIILGSILAGITYRSFKDNDISSADI
ncbi:MAG: chromate transporter [Candidatus Gastranaerophilaceae bacterium]|nr:chromate transporter [Candidatus Gastranaerophilaceae bacterium]